jgi:8-oxo-dGTP pyrophosphatase MutT (NUDIX family)
VSYPYNKNKIFKQKKMKETSSREQFNHPKETRVNPTTNILPDENAKSDGAPVLKTMDRNDEHSHMEIHDGKSINEQQSTPLIKPIIDSSEILYNGFLELQCDTLLLPPDFKTRYRYYKVNSRGKSAVSVIAKTLDGLIIVNKEYRHPTNVDFLYGFPGGLVDKNETPEQAAQRELMEETGFYAPLKNFKRIGSSYPLPALSGLQMYFVAAHGLEKKMEQNLEPSENLRVELMCEEKIESLLTTQMDIEESGQKSQECPPRALNVDGNFVAALWYYQKYQQRHCLKK